MGHSVSIARESARNDAARFGREILRPTAVENCGKKLPGYCFGRMVNALWAKKPAAHVEYYTGAPDRTARQYAAGKSDPPSTILVKVIRSDHGWVALEYIMRGCRQPWWLEVQRAVRCARAYEAERQQYELDL